MAYLAKECLLLDPESRPTMSEVVQILSTIAPEKSRRRNYSINLLQVLKHISQILCLNYRWEVSFIIRKWPNMSLFNIDSTQQKTIWHNLFRIENNYKNNAISKWKKGNCLNWLLALTYSQEIKMTHPCCNQWIKCRNVALNFYSSPSTFRTSCVCPTSLKCVQKEITCFKCSHGAMISSLSLLFLWINASALLGEHIGHVKCFYSCICDRVPLLVA